jgi:hypothetical protein
MADVAQCLNGPVTAGDLVRVVLPTLCCGNRSDVGAEYHVRAVEAGLAECQKCRAVTEVVVCLSADDSGIPAGMLVRIDPPALPESVEDVREVTA